MADFKSCNMTQNPSVCHLHHLRQHVFIGSHHHQLLIFVNLQLEIPKDAFKGLRAKVES